MHTPQPPGSPFLCALLVVTAALSACASTTPAARTAVSGPGAHPLPTREAARTRVHPETAPAMPRGQPETGVERTNDGTDAVPAWGKRFYLDDGPGDLPAAELDRIPDAVPVAEAPYPRSNRPYTVFGKTYTPLGEAAGFSQRGLASWYGRRFHGKPTSSGEPYDMYGMSAAHPTLPIPSYARVTNVVNGRSVVVRINDRGPFHPGRILDLSYAAAHRLGFAGKGSAEVAVEALVAGDGSAASGVFPLTTAGTGTGAVATPIPTQQDLGTATRIERTAKRVERGADEPGDLWLQLGAFNRRENAEALRQSVSAKLPELTPGLTVVEIDGKWRLRVGPLYDREAMDYVRTTLKEKMGIKAVSVRP